MIAKTKQLKYYGTKITQVIFRHAKNDVTLTIARSRGAVGIGARVIEGALLVL